MTEEEIYELEKNHWHKNQKKREKTEEIPVEDVRVATSGDLVDFS